MRFGSSPSSRRRQGGIGLGGSAMAFIAVAGALAATPAWFSAEAANEAQIAAPDTGCRWSLDQVRGLVAEIAAARNHGFDPSRYGLAALNGQLELNTRLLGKECSRPLDQLADAAALALAADYVRGPAADPRQFDWRRPPEAPAGLAKGLDAAIEQGRVQPWLHGLRAGRNPA